MARKKFSLLEASLFIASKLPWWLNIGLAITSYFSLHTYVANRSISIRSAKDISAALSTQVFVGVASILQYVLPLIFVAGVAGSVFLRAKRQSDADSKFLNANSRIEPTIGRRQEVVPIDRFSLKLLQAIDWKRFEELCAEYFRILGFRAATQTHGPDGGIDIVLHAAENPNVVGALVQCKRWTTQVVGPKAVRELLGIMTDRKVAEGIFVTTSTFNDEAMSLARTNHIELIDGKTLLRQIRALTTEQQQRLLNVATEGDYLTPSCPSCGIKLVKRENRSDASKFWGCTNYPKCRFTLIA